MKSPREEQLLDAWRDAKRSEKKHQRALLALIAARKERTFRRAVFARIFNAPREEWPDA
jgi:hypothetical protein